MFEFKAVVDNKEVTGIVEGLSYNRAAETLTDVYRDKLDSIEFLAPAGILLNELYRTNSPVYEFSGSEDIGFENKRFYIKQFIDERGISELRDNTDSEGRG